MKRKAMLVATIAILIGGCASEQKQPDTVDVRQADPRQCAQHFSVEGSFWTGRKLSTYEEFPKKTVSGAFDQLLSAVAAGGYNVTSASKETGFISGNMAVGFSSGQKVTFSISVKRSATSGIRVDLASFLAGGLATSLDAAREEGCKLLSSVLDSPDESARKPLVKQQESTASAKGDATQSSPVSPKQSKKKK